MKAFLMYPDRDFEVRRLTPFHEDALIADLELDVLFEAMGCGDNYLSDLSRQVLLSSLTDAEVIRYRQNIIKDCLQNPDVIMDLYRIPLESIEKKRKRWMGIYSHTPSGVLTSALEMMQMFLGLLKSLRRQADEHGSHFESQGFSRFFKMIQSELNDEYLAEVEEHLGELEFNKGVTLSVELGPGNEGTNYVLRKPKGKRPSWLKEVFSRQKSGYSFYIDEESEADDSRALSELRALRDLGLKHVAIALGRAANHIDKFFNMLRIELAFYVGCINLYKRLEQLESPICYPLPALPEVKNHAFRGLYDVCLALTMNRQVVPNDLQADNRKLAIITGANQGGKSVFLRSVGLAQLMMQCGMFVPAQGFSASLCTDVFTHYQRGEDLTMESGKLDEELGRLSKIVDELTPNSLLLLNETLAATNAREGSALAKQIIRALLENQIKVFYVTHLAEFARQSYEEKMDGVIYLQPEREADGTRTFRLKEGEPRQSSYGEDIYKTVFEPKN